MTSWPKYRIRLDYFVCPAKKKAKRILLGGNRMSNRGFRRLPLSSRLELASPNSKEVPAFVVDVEHGLSDSTCMFYTTRILLLLLLPYVVRGRGASANNLVTTQISSSWHKDSKATHMMRFREISRNFCEIQQEKINFTKKFKL